MSYRDSDVEQLLVVRKFMTCSPVTAARSIDATLI